MFSGGIQASISQCVVRLLGEVQNSGGAEERRLVHHKEPYHRAYYISIRVSLHKVYSNTPTCSVG